MPQGDAIQEISVAEFFQKNRQMLGYQGRVRSLTTAVHELVSNSLDACEVQGILPEIEVKIKKNDDEYILSVKDNGPGMEKEEIKKAFGKLLTGTKFGMRQERGQQGIGASGVILFSMLTTGKPAKIISWKDGKRIEIHLKIDVKKNEPIVISEREEKEDGRGLLIEVALKEVLYEQGKFGPLEYIRRLHLANPHAKFTFLSPFNELFVMERKSEKPVVLHSREKYHPSSIVPYQLLEILREERSVQSGLLKKLERFHFQRLLELKARLPHIDFGKAGSALTYDEAEQIIAELQKMGFSSPSEKGLVGIDEKTVAMLLSQNSEFVCFARKRISSYSGVPFMVQVVASLSQEGKLLRYANRVPLIFDQNACLITAVFNSINWKYYKVEKEKLTMLVNVSSFYVPYQSAGKQAIAEIPELEREIKNAMLEVGRKIREWKEKNVRKEIVEKKKEFLRKYAKLVAEELRRITNSNERYEDFLYEIIERRIK